MSRPEDISQDVWDAADKVRNDTSMRYPFEAKVIIARAIQAAKLEAFEQAAKVAEKYGSPNPGRPPSGEFERISGTVWDGMDNLVRVKADQIAAAIRKLGEGK